MITSQHVGSVPHGTEGPSEHTLTATKFQDSQQPEFLRAKIDPRVHDIALMNYLRQAKFERETAGL